MMKEMETIFKQIEKVAYDIRRLAATKGMERKVQEFLIRRANDLEMKLQLLIDEYRI
jgi:hypothetical protein